MRISTKGKNLLKALEGRGGQPDLKSYQDVGGVWTIGDGSILMFNKQGVLRPVVEGDTITKANAKVLFKVRLAEFETAVTRYAKQTTQHEFDAWVIFAYNVGVKGFRKSTALTRFNAGQTHEAAAALQWWNKSGGKFQRPLLRRRIAEGRMLEYGFYDKTPYGDPADDDYLPAIQTSTESAVGPSDLEGRGDLTQSRTQRAALATTGAITTAGAVSATLKQGSDVVEAATGAAQQAGVAFGLNTVELLLAAGLCAALAGVAYMAWCRYDDHSKGRR